MSLIKTVQKLFGTASSSPQDYSKIEPTCNDAVDGPLLILLVIAELGDSPRGFSNNFWLQQYVYQTERELVQQDIPVNTYTWIPTDYADLSGKAPRSQELKDDLELIARAGGDEPIVYVASKREAYLPTDYTDFYIDKFNSNMDPDISTVEDAFQTVLNLYGDMSLFGYHDAIVEQNPDKFF